MINVTSIILAVTSNFVMVLDRDVSMSELYCMTVNTWHEARSEPLDGQIAVSHAVLERVKDSRYPNTACGVIYSSIEDPANPGHPLRNKCAFSWYCDGKRDDIKLVKANGDIDEDVVDQVATGARASLLAMIGDVPTQCEGSNFYYNPTVSRPRWAKHYDRKCKIGNHVFMERSPDSVM